MYRSVVASGYYSILKYVSLHSESILGYIYLYPRSFNCSPESCCTNDNHQHHLCKHYVNESFSSYG
jgi:hypothetical protein